MVLNMTEYNKQWYAKNRDKHLAYCKEKIECECGRKVGRCTMNKHRKTNIHTIAVEKLNKERKELQGNIIKEIVKVADMKNKIDRAAKDIKKIDIEALDPEQTETSDINKSDDKPKEDDVKDAQIIYKCNKCGYESEDRKKYGSHFVSNRHKYASYRFD
jgi:rubrerythrin